MPAVSPARGIQRSVPFSALADRNDVDVKPADVIIGLLDADARLLRNQSILVRSVLL